MKSYVYLIYNENSDISDYVKIGKADDVELRFSRLQIGNPNKLKLAAVIECKNSSEAYRLETELHRKYAHLHVRGEWFHWTENIVNEFKIDENLISSKKVRDSLINNTLWENEKTEFGIETFPSCFFYPQLYAQIMTNYEDAQKLTVPWRTMEFPTGGKQMLIGSDGKLLSDKVNRVFISGRKHQENLDLNNFLKSKNSKHDNLRAFYE